MKPKLAVVTSNQDEYASVEQAREAIEGLRDPDFAKLTVIAKYFWHRRLRNLGVDPEDLLHEAVLKTLSGTRRWRASISIVKHLDRVMESESSHILEKRSKELSLEDSPASALATSPDARLAAAQELEHLLELFADDQLALDVLRLRGEGFDASEIQQELGIGKTQYATVTRRIRRRVASHLE